MIHKLNKTGNKVAKEKSIKERLLIVETKINMLLSGVSVMIIVSLFNIIISK